MIPRVALGAVMVSVVVLLACAQHPAGARSVQAASVQEVTVRSTDQFRFEPTTLTVRANTPVHLTLDNTGSAMVHDFTIDNVGGKKVHIVAQPHSRATGELTPTAAGGYQFYCSEPGHKEAGMVGTLIVS